MTDYSQMSDFQINSLVSAHLWGSVCSVDGVVLHNEKDGAFDPCNNVSDGWPIVIESEIGLMKDKGDGSWDAFGKFKLFDGDWQFESDPVHHHSDRNPLRAAMVVFLKMKDAENVDHF